MEKNISKKLQAELNYEYQDYNVCYIEYLIKYIFPFLLKVLRKYNDLNNNLVE